PASRSTRAPRSAGWWSLRSPPFGPVLVRIARGVRALGPVPPRRVDEAVVVIPVVVPYPVGQVEGGTGLVATLRREVEVVVRAEQDVAPARVAGIGMEDVAGLVLVEHAGTEYESPNSRSTGDSGARRYTRDPWPSTSQSQRRSR